MSRTPARITQADIARAVRAVAQCRVRAVIEVAPDGTIRVVMGGDATPEPKKIVEEDEEIVM